MTNITRIVPVIAAVLLLSGCAGSNIQYSELEPIPAGSAIRLEIITAGAESADVESNSEAVVGTAGKGAGRGAGYGLGTAAIISTLCTGAFFLCFSVFAPGTIALGAVTGTLIGGVAGSLKGLPEEESEQLEAAVVQFTEAMPVGERLAEQFLSDIDGRLTLDEDATQNVVIHIDGFTAEQPHKNHVSFLVHARMTIGYGDDRMFTEPVAFSASTPPRVPEYWLENDGENLSVALASAMERLSADIALTVVE